MIPIESASADFVMDPAPDGGVDLFRRAPVGFVLVDTFETPALAHTFIEEFSGGVGTVDPANGPCPVAA